MRLLRALPTSGITTLHRDMESPSCETSDSGFSANLGCFPADPASRFFLPHLTLSHLVLLSQGLPHLPGSSLWVIFMDLCEDALEEGLVFAELTGVQLPQRLLAGQAGVFASFPILGVEREDAFLGQGPFFLLELETVELAAL